MRVRIFCSEGKSVSPGPSMRAEMRDSCWMREARCFVFLKGFTIILVSQRERIRGACDCGAKSMIIPHPTFRAAFAASMAAPGMRGEAFMARSPREYLCVLRLGWGGVSVGSEG